MLHHHKWIKFLFFLCLTTHLSAIESEKEPTFDKIKKNIEKIGFTEESRNKINESLNELINTNKKNICLNFSNLQLEKNCTITRRLKKNPAPLQFAIELLFSILPTNLLKNVTTLDLSGNNLCYVPENFTKFENIKRIKLSDNNIKSFPHKKQDTKNCDPRKT
jgi:hypothetical protein